MGERRCVNLGKALGKRGERLHERLGERFKWLGEMLNPNMLQVCFRQVSSTVQESLTLPQLPSHDEGLVSLGL